MLSSHSLPETQAALALSIFFATFIYEDGATLLAATLSAGGSLDPRIGLLTTFLGIWVGDMGLYWLGLQFRAAHGAVTLAAEILKARVTRQGRRVVCQTWIVGLGHEPRDSRKPSTSLCGRRRVTASGSTVCQDDRSLLGCLGLRDLCHLAVHSQSIVRPSEIAPLAADRLCAVRAVAAEQERQITRRMDSESRESSRLPNGELCAR